jgi:hypothetical protein
MPRSSRGKRIIAGQPSRDNSTARTLSPITAPPARTTQVPPAATIVSLRIGIGVLLQSGWQAAFSQRAVSGSTSGVSISATRAW